MFLALKERLQLDWVAWRLHVFYKRKKHKFIFIISWNETEGKFAITCYYRMAQRQRSSTSGQVYLGHDLDTCGWKILSQEFFMETHDREYYEPLASCSRRARKGI
ncbi:junction-mediating and -regulatory protein-like [Vicugna pacos]|uniref:Junction-mediating and -regulatory protein-like n=1 Tax=Vicugna pacos TaxID=30538 RepID=A0ABM5CRB3_VICPA